MKRLMAAGVALVLTTGCAAGVGAGVGAALIAVGIATHECYEYVNITVIDGATGHETCAAEVKTIEDGDEEVLGSCYHAPLTPGRWTIRAELPDRKPATVTFDVKDRDGCEPAVSSVVLTIPAPGAAAGPRPLVPAPAPPAPAPAPAAPPSEAAPPAEAAPGAAPAPEAAPPPAESPAPVEAAPPPASAPIPAPSAPPSATAPAPPATGAPPTQRFPD